MVAGRPVSTQSPASSRPRTGVSRARAARLPGRQRERRMSLAHGRRVQQPRGARGRNRARSPPEHRSRSARRCCARRRARRRWTPATGANRHAGTSLLCRTPTGTRVPETRAASRRARPVVPEIDRDDGRTASRAAPVRARRPATGAAGANLPERGHGAALITTGAPAAHRGPQRRPPVAVRADSSGGAGPHLGAPGAQPRAGRLDVQVIERNSRNDAAMRARFRAEHAAQHFDEGVRRGMIDRLVQRRQRERFPE